MSRVLGGRSDLTWWCYGQALAEIQRILVQDPRTKDVFRELDGFLVLMSVLSTVQEQPSSGSAPGPSSSPIVVVSDGDRYAGGDDDDDGEEPVLVDVVERTRLVFMILSQAMYGHPLNAEWFRVGCFSILLGDTDFQRHRHA